MPLEKIREFDIPTVGVMEPFNNIHSLMEYTRVLKGKEGFVVAFSDGHKVKIKAEEYVSIHRTKELLSNDRYILEMIVNNTVDDAIPLLEDEDRLKLHSYWDWWSDAVANKRNRLEQVINKIYSTEGFYNEGLVDRKKVALEVIPTLAKDDAQFIFGFFDGRDMGEMLLAKAKKSIGTNKNYLAYVDWLLT